MKYESEKKAILFVNFKQKIKRIRLNQHSDFLSLLHEIRKEKMLSGEKMWPQKYGFKIVGNGPTFIASVEPGSDAEESGLVPGDRLMELDGHDISNLSADVLTILMKETNGHPPAVGVVSNVTQIYLTCKTPQRCGFSVCNKKPIIVSHVDPTGLAFAAGLRKGDIILAVNNKPINKFGHKELVLIAENDHLVLSVIPTGIREDVIMDDFRGPQIKTSKFLFSKVAKCCDKDYHKKMALVGVLTDYSEDWDIHNLCSSLDNILKEPEDRKLLKHIEPFIPRHQKDVFKPLMRKKKLYKDCQHLAYIRNKPIQKLNFRILRGNNPYGFVLKGNSPVHVEWIDPGGPADYAGLLPGDFIIAINQIDTKNFSHEEMIKLLQFCGPVPTVDVERYKDTIGDVGIISSYESASLVSSTLSVESFNWICNEFSDVTDSEGWTFKQKMEYLLTPKERSQLQMDYLQYINSRNIVKFYQKLSQILDSPSRRTLWQFLLTKMSKSHQEYIHLKENLSETPQDKSTKCLLEYYLNSKEVAKMKDVLDLYLKNRNFDQVKIMERILNTQAKEELWSNIFPHLIPEHLHIIRKQREDQKRIFADFHRGIVRNRSSNIYLPPSTESVWDENGSEEEFKLLEAAVDSVNISNDWLPSNLSSEEESASVNGMNSLPVSFAFHGNSAQTHSSSYLSKKPTTFSSRNDIPKSKSLQQEWGDTQSLGFPQEQTPRRKKFVPPKPKRKTLESGNRIPDPNLSSEDTQSSYGLYPPMYNQRAPSMPNIYLMPAKGRDLKHSRSLQSSQQHISSQLPRNRTESKTPRTHQKEVNSSGNKYRKGGSNKESYYDRNNADEVDSDVGRKSGMYSMRDQTNLNHKHRNVLPTRNPKTTKNSQHQSTPVFTYANAEGKSELTTFGKVKNRGDQVYSSKDRISPIDISDDKAEYTDKFGYTVLDLPGVKGSPKVARHVMGPLIDRSSKNKNPPATISMKGDDSPVTPRQLTFHPPPVIAEKLRKTEAVRNSAFHPYSKDSQVSVRPQSFPHSCDPQDEEVTKTDCNHVEHLERTLDLPVDDGLPEKGSIAPQKPLRLKNIKRLSEDLGTAPISPQTIEQRLLQKFKEDIDIQTEDQNHAEVDQGLTVTKKRPNLTRPSETRSSRVSQIRNQLSNSENQLEPSSNATDRVKPISDTKNTRHYDDNDEERDSSSFSPNIGRSMSVMEKIKELEAQKNIPKPPPAPFIQTVDKNHILRYATVKHLHWEKLERNSVEGTVWNKPQTQTMNDMLPDLELDTNFGCKTATVKPAIQKKKRVDILDSKKAYNISILLGHLKLSISDIKKAIMTIDESVLTKELLQQLLAYAPNKAEIEEYEKFSGETKDLNQADMFSYEMIQITNYKDRIQALIFKASFTEQAEELKTTIANLKSASLELRNSELLTNILQLILVMGNYLNRGNERISDASGFRISFLMQIDNTKTSDNKMTFLHFLADALVKKFPNSPSLCSELSSVLKVAKVSSMEVNNEIKELTSSQKNITNIIENLQVCNSEDKIQEVMANFLIDAEKTIQVLTESLDEAMKEFQETLQYFGETDKNTNTQKIFDLFASFAEKFEKSRRDISMKVNT